MLIVALVLRVCAALWWQGHIDPRRFAFSDSDSYWVLGGQIATGGPYAYISADRQVLRAPGYPLLLAGLFKLAGSSDADRAMVVAARLIGACLGAAAVAAGAWWAARLFGTRAAVLAGWVLAFYPGAIAMSIFVLSEALFCPLMLIQLALWSMALRAARPGHAAWWSLATGIVAAGASLTRPDWLLFTPLAALLSLADPRRRWRAAMAAALILVGLGLGMAPWWIRNSQVTGHFVPTTLAVGASLYDSLSPHADGSSNFNFVDRQAAIERGHFRAAVPVGGENLEFWLDRRLGELALGWALEHPGEAARLAAVKFARTWNLWPNDAMFRSVPTKIAVAASYTPLLLLGLAGAWRFSRGGFEYWLAWLPAVYFALLHIVFVGSIRYREPAMMALAALAAGELGVWLRWPHTADQPNVVTT